MVEPMVIDVKDTAKENLLFRRVLFTGTKSQLVVMSLRPGEEIGLETHDVDQLIYVVKGDGVASIDGKDYELEDGAIVCVPAGLRHNIINRDDKPMKLFTVYSPPQHAPGTVHATKQAAIDAEAKETVPA